MYKVVIQPSPDAFKRKSTKLRLYFDDIPTMKALMYAIDEELFGDPKNKLFYKGCKRVVLEMGVPRLGPYRSNTSCCAKGIVSLRLLRVYKST
jgi:hypothetical protein